MSKIVKGIAYGGGIIAFGYALLKYTVPSEEEMQKRLGTPLNKAQEKANRERMMEHMRAAAESDKPVWISQEPPLVNDKPATP
ncbi:hypothetical protein VTP01DRAFT_9164 [Rhizomucor pusillus]|uniref:uncharacterized protein n=1 Tax=Rhizomucor pusillus TaxID=4840 RepID=UPI0037434CEE